MRALFYLLLFITACFGYTETQTANSSPESQKSSDKVVHAKSIEELQTQLEQMLKEMHVPGMSIAVVHRDGPEWIAGLGQANVASGQAVTKETLFRIGSTSKAFASLSILKLAEEGKLSLDDPVHKLVPEVWFENRWEESDPIRVVHLLEHTTGWDDMHLREYAKEAPNMTLREAFDYDHHSRISRWKPGTRMAYCNSGPAVAAYIVEKVTGKSFEEYVKENFFIPIGMKTATYFQPDSKSTTTLYHNDGRTPYSYWHIIYRPAGSINASANDMTNYLLFYLNRGAVNDIKVIPSKDLDRMENPATTWSAKEGLKGGYGLGNYWTVQNGFVWHGHNGGLDGDLTEMAYMPDIGIGYFYSINTSDEKAFLKIGEVIRAYITSKLSKPSVPAAVPLSAKATDYAGWYELDSAREESMHFLECLLGKVFLHFKDNKLLLATLEGNLTYLPVSETQFRYLPKDKSPDPIPTLALLSPNSEGQFFQLGLGMQTMKRIPTWLALSEISVTAFVLLSIVSILIYAPFWLLGGLCKKRRRPLERAMRIWPLMAVLSLIAAIAIIGCSSYDMIPRLGNLTVWSFSLFLTTLAFAVASIASAISIWRAPKQDVRRNVRVYSTIVTVALMTATVYLAYWGIIGLRSWS